MKSSDSVCGAVERERPATDKILFVDDEPSVLDAIQRALHKRFDIHVAESAEEGLVLIKKDGAYAVVVAEPTGKRT